MDLFDYEKTGKQLAEEGAELAADKAEREVPGWKEQALDCLHRYALTHADFINEEVTAYAYECGLAEPPSKGAWGHVVTTAKKARYIEFVGYCERSTTPARHGTPSRLWRSLIYPRAVAAQ